VGSPPIVPVVNTLMGLYEFVGTIYKVTANQVAKLDKDPSPCLFSSLEEGKTFSELNLAYAYQQVPLEDD